MTVGIPSITTEQNLKNQIINSIQQVESRTLAVKRVTDKINIDDETSKILEDIQSYCYNLQNIIENRKLAINYLQLFQNDVHQLLNAVNQYYPKHSLNFFEDESKIIEFLKNNYSLLKNILDSVSFNLNFFKILNFLSSNIVAVGANGSGKTTLVNRIRSYLNNSGVVIGAQKILLVPTFNAISSINNTSQKLEESRKLDKTNKLTFDTIGGSSYSILNKISDEFMVLLENLLAENNSKIHNYMSEQKKGILSDIPVTKLDKVIEVWNGLIQHREMILTDGVQLQLKVNDNGEVYNAHQMSDGEKVILYLVAQVLQAPQSSFVIVDEPEMYLHKTILNKLWDTLESERNDCIFIYLTHDLDFASQRTSAKKIWVKSFTYPDKWELEEIPDNEIPEALLMELLGSRKNILFCEGKIDSNDLRIYNQLFPHLTIKPVDSCANVINYTKAFNKLENTNVKALGLIDSDFHTTERLQSLMDDNIYSLKVAEVENLLMSEDFLNQMANWLCPSDNEVVEKIKTNALTDFSSNIDTQVSSYVSTKINNYFEGSHVSKGKNLNEVITHYNDFTNKIEISDWYNKRKNFLESIIASQNYDEMLKVYNNKGLKKFANEGFQISNFTERALEKLKDSEAKSVLLSYFPNEVKS